MTNFSQWIRCTGQSGATPRISWYWRLSTSIHLYARAFVLVMLLMIHASTLAAPVPQPARSVQGPLREAFPSYVGLDTIHVSYTYENPCTGCRRDLEVILPSQSVEVLTTLAAGSVIGSFRHEGLTPGQYGYRIIETRLIDEMPVYTTTLRSGSVDGLTIGGRMLFNETLYDWFACEYLSGVTVLDGVGLTLDGTHLNSNCGIALEGNASLSAQSSTFLGSDLSISGTGTADIIGSTFDASMILNVGPAVLVNITQSYFPHPLQIGDSARQLRFQTNHFGDVVRLLARSAVVFEKNLFLNSIILDDQTTGTDSWCQDNGLNPTIEGNSFVGRNALSYSIANCGIAGLKPIDVGQNYYGDPQGPVYGQKQDDPVVPGITYGHKWLQRGAVVLPNLFQLNPHLVSGTQWQDTQVFPTFWLNGYRLGQHTLTDQIPTLMRGKESLLTVDLVTSHARVDGAKVWVMWNGQKVDPSSPSSPSPTLVRDRGRSAVVLRSAGSTIDFFLPPTEGEIATLELWLDTRSLTDFADAGSSGALTKLLDLTVNLKAPPPLVGIHIVPVTIDSVTPSISNMRATLKSVTPAMLPLTAQNLRVSSTAYSPAWNSTYMPTAMLLNAVATDLVRYRWALQYDPVEFPKGELMDFVVGVMPAGSMGGGDGVYMNLRQHIVLVDEDKPEAVFHEMGHVIGLYNMIEQYNWPRYPPNGRPVEGVTLFLNQATTSNATINGVFAGDPGRVVHTPKLGQWWYDPFLVVVDVMGNTAPFWPHLDTLQSFQNYFYSLSAEPRPTAISMTAAAALRRVIVTVESERVEVTEVSLYQGERRCAAYRPIIKTARLHPRDAFTSAVGGIASEPDVIQGALPLCLTADSLTYAPGDIQLCLMPISEDGDIMPEYYTCQRVLAPDEVNTARQRDVAVLFFDVPVSAARYSLVTTRNQALPLLLTSSTALDVALLTPAAGQTLTDTVTLGWSSQATLRNPEVPTGQPLLHQVSYSSDNGVTWSPVGMPVEGNSMTLNSNALPPGDQLAFRVTVSDGFITDDDQVSGLHLPVRSPDVVIHSPQDGDRAVPGHAWFLQAWGWDNNIGSAVTGTWRSSRDGPLGTGPVLSAVVLSTGTHNLTYSVIDGFGTAGEAHVTVKVEAMPTVDLAIVPDALAITMPWRDPVVVQAPRLQTGTPQTATLMLRNTGAAVTATLQLFIRPPGTVVERLVAEETLSLAPYETHWIGGTFTATVAGTHRFRGVVAAQSPLDNDSSNDESQWDIMAASPARLVSSAATVEFSAPADTPVDRSITLRNAGGLGMIIQKVALEQGAALSTGFRLWSDGCSGTALAPNEVCRVTVRYTPTAGVEEQARLEINSTDLDQPAQVVALTGKVGELMVDLKFLYLPLVVR